MAKVGTVQIEIKPVLNRAALDGIGEELAAAEQTWKVDGHSSAILERIEAHLAKLVEMYAAVNSNQ